MRIDKLECSVWNNGANGWGIRVLGGVMVRQAHFRRDVGPIVVEVDGVEHHFNIDKNSFWTRSFGELIGRPLREWKGRHGLKSGDRVYLCIVEPYRRFCLETEVKGN